VRERERERVYKDCLFEWLFLKKENTETKKKKKGIKIVKVIKNVNLYKGESEKEK